MTTSRLLAEADDAIESLRLAVNDRDEALTWGKVTSALDVLHRLEEWIKKNNSDYYSQRAKVDDGKLTAALMWARGLVHHAGVDWRPVAWVRYGPLRQKQADGSWSDLLAGTRPHILQLAWPERRELPPPEKKRDPDGRGRDILYDNFVARRPLLEPVDTARRFLAAWQ